MNVTCTGCPAKYAVPDEKVRGKKVRITCKHCGTNIVVDGTVAADTSDIGSPKPAGQGPSQPSAPSPTTIAEPSRAASKAGEAQKAVQAKPAAAAAEVMYIVGFADDRQHPHSVSQIVEMYGAGKIDDETLVWKDGMPDWLSPFDVPELAAAFRAKNVAPRATGAAFAPATEDEATLVVRSPLENAELAAAIAAATPLAAPIAAAPAPVAAAAPAPVAATAPIAAASPVPAGIPATTPADQSLVERPAARRVEKRAGAVDLFGGLSEAGSEGDVSLDLGSSEERAHKLTGARNESSVLFSLDALTKAEPKTNKAKDKEKEKEREASEALFGESAPDSLMNLGSSGLGALAAPDFTKPVSKVVAPVPLGEPLAAPDAATGKGRGGVVLLVGFVAIAAAAAVAFVMMKKQPTAESVSTPPSAETPVRASAEPSAADTPSASAAPAASEAPVASAVPAASASGASSATPAGSTDAIAATAGAAATKAIAPGTPATPAAPAAPAANKPAEPAAAAKAPEAPAAAAPAATPEAAAFDKNAAVAALGAAAASAASCKKPDGPTGSGKVSVTFAPSGRATATSVAGELAGTEVGGCVARIFRSAKVPPFSGDPVTVSKSFTVQ